MMKIIEVNRARAAADERPGEAGEEEAAARQRKAAAVLRLLNGDNLETVSWSLGVTAATVSRWARRFFAAGEAALTTKRRS
jgi:transposase